MKPRLKALVHIVRDGDLKCHLIASEREIFRCQGKSVPILVDKVIPLLDGTRTVEQLCEALAGTLNEKGVRDLLELLSRYHVLVDAVGLTDIVDSDSGCFRGIHNLLSRYSDRPAPMLQALRNARVAVLGTGPLVQDTVQALAECAIGHIDVLWAGRHLPLETIERVVHRSFDVSEMTKVLPGATLTLALQDGEFGLVRPLRELNRLSLRELIPWLHVRLSLDAEAWIGPIYVKGGPCFECTHWRSRSNLRSAKEVEMCEALVADGIVSEKRMDFRPFQRHLASAVAFDVVQYIAGLDPNGLIERCRVVDLITHEASTHVILRHPYCKACGMLEFTRLQLWDMDVLRIERMLLPSRTPRDT